MILVGGASLVVVSVGVAVVGGGGGGVFVVVVTGGGGGGALVGVRVVAGGDAAVSFRVNNYSWKYRKNKVKMKSPSSFFPPATKVSIM